MSNKIVSNSAKRNEQIIEAPTLLLLALEIKEDLDKAAQDLKRIREDYNVNAVIKKRNGKLKRAFNFI